MIVDQLVNAHLYQALGVFLGHAPKAPKNPLIDGDSF